MANEQVAMSKTRSLLFQTLVVIGGSLLLALSAQLAIPLPFTPIPVTMQTLAVMLLGASLGSRLGTLAVLTYILEAFCGLPLLAGGNILTPFTPTFGYLIGFLAQAYLTGLWFEKQSTPALGKAFIVLTLTSFVQLALGTAWLGLLVGWKLALPLGFYPFILGAFFKITLALPIVQKSFELQRRLRL